MKTRNKASGFFIVEVLIVLVLIALLTIILLPNLQQYTNRAKFQDVIRSAMSLKPAVEACFLRTGALTTCTGGTSNTVGIPVDVSGLGGGTLGNLAALAVSGGAITATATAAAPLSAATIMLTPTTAAGNTNSLIWTSSGTCSTLGLC